MLSRRNNDIEFNVQQMFLSLYVNMLKILKSFLQLICHRTLIGKSPRCVRFEREKTWRANARRARKSPWWMEKRVRSRQTEFNLSPLDMLRYTWKCFDAKHQSFNPSDSMPTIHECPLDKHVRVQRVRCPTI